MSDTVGGDGTPDMDDTTTVWHFILVDVLGGVVIVHRVDNAEIQEELVKDLPGSKDGGISILLSLKRGGGRLRAVSSCPSDKRSALALSPEWRDPQQSWGSLARTHPP